MMLIGEYLQIYTDHGYRERSNIGHTKKFGCDVGITGASANPTGSCTTRTTQYNLVLSWREVTWHL